MRLYLRVGGVAGGHGTAIEACTERQVQRRFCQTASGYAIGMSEGIKDAMSSPAVLIESEASVLDAAKLMADRGVGAIGVTDGGKLSGVVTDRDIVVRGIAKGVDASSTQVTDIASTDAVTVSCDDSLEKAHKLMVERRVRRLFVLDQDDIVGVLSNDDVAALRDEDSVEAQQLHELEHSVRRDYQGHTGQGE